MSRRQSRPLGIVSLADALIAVDDLSEKQRQQAWQWLPELIGMERHESPSPVGGDDRTTRQSTSTTGSQRIDEEEPSIPAPQDRLDQREARRRAPTLPVRLMARETNDPGWLDETENDSLGEAKPFAPADIPELLPLFDPRHMRPLLSSGLATPQPDGGLDLSALLKAVAQRRVIERLPRLMIPTTRLGLQLLLDRSDAMMPYLRDQLHLADAIRNTVGQDRVDIWRFTGNPEDGMGRRGRSTWHHSYTPPPPGTPVVVLTDLGIGARHSSAAEAESVWLAFGRRLQRADCPALAIVPYVRERVPLSVRSGFHILPWSWTTTVATVRQWIGHGLVAGQ